MDSHCQYNTFRRICQLTETRRFQNHRMHLAAFTAILGNLSFGYALVYTSPVIPELEHSLDPQLRLDNYNASFFESIFTLGVIFGGLTTMLLNDLLGRKLTIMLSSVPSVLGFAIMGSAQVVWMLDLGRALTGIAGGMLSGTVPIYIAEISVAKIRGRMGVGPQIMLVLGTLLLYALGLVLSWRWLAIVGAFIPTLMITLMYFMPESPRYLISKHRYSEAMEALAWLRGPEANYRLEYTEIEDSLSSSAGRYDAVPVGVVRFFSVLLAAWLMDKAGRRRLLFVSGIIMSISMLSLGVYVKVSELKHNQTSTNMPFENTAHLTAEHLLQHKTTEWSTIIPLISVMVFIFGYAFGWGPITWLMMSEILPLKIRGFASGVCVSVSWITAFILTEFFLQVKHTFGLAVPFLFFCAISILGIIFTAFCIPETRRRTLEQIQDSFQNPRALGC
ncbi:solute carrier family 2, facilitated glucose transporter member 6 isoform X3 [Rhincodon typus]|uniref:solute carrier family 2, facilitated glucose transporter member 6 isoform X3 n=1 Tax=Rhincodon typus TaxID=259920 RepID=UPI00202E10FE|nr:solute carrier family 2, facilitated glucose transporter member 6 isoform X3 [Rhincodon typus]